MVEKKAVNELKNHFDKSVFQCKADEYLLVKIRPLINGSKFGVATVMTLRTHDVRLRMRNLSYFQATIIEL